MPKGYIKKGLEVKRLKALERSSGDLEERIYDDLGKEVNVWAELKGHHKKLV